MEKPVFLQHLKRCDLGLLRGSLSLMPYTEAWIQAFHKVKSYLSPHLNAAIIEHVGSTSIPGCMAKPILDIMVVFAASSLFQEETQALVRLGFTSKGELGIPGRHYFNYYNEEKTVDYIHIHAYPYGHPDIENMRTFRNFLRDHTDMRDQYIGLKKQLIAQGIPRKDYPDAKSSFIRNVLNAAHTERK